MLEVVFFFFFSTIHRPKFSCEGIGMGVSLDPARVSGKYNDIY